MQTSTGVALSEAPGSGDSGPLQWWAEWVERLTTPVADAIAVALFAFTGLAAFFYVHTYSVNMIFDDQWTDVDLLQRAQHGGLTWSYIWSQHNEHRMIFPKLLVLALGATTHLNIQVEDYLCVLAMCGTTALIILTHRRRSPGLPLLVYCPVAFVLLSPAVVAEGLLGFNIAWFMSLLALGIVLYLLDAEVVGRVPFAIAVAVTVVASYSCLQGLLIWPAILVLLWLRRRSWAALAVWVGVGALTTGLYFIGFVFSQAEAGTASAPRTFAATVKYFVIEVGNVLGSQAGLGVDRFFGGIVLALALFCLVAGLRRGVADGAPVGVALIVFGMAFLVSATVGRAQLGLGDSLRYAPFVLMILVGAYLVLLSWCIRVFDPPEGGVAEVLPWVAPGARMWTPVVLVVALFGLSVFQAVESNRVGPADSGGWHTEQLTIANVTANITKVPDFVVSGNLGGYAVPYMRDMAAYARTEHLSLFDTPLATEDEKDGLFPELHTAVLAPPSGTRLHGTVTLRAGVVGSDATALQFVLYGQGLDYTPIVSASPTPKGWVARWNTKGVGDGSYYMASQLTVADGETYTSPLIAVFVANH